LDPFWSILDPIFGRKRGVFDRFWSIFWGKNPDFCQKTAILGGFFPKKCQKMTKNGRKSGFFGVFLPKNREKT